MSVPLLIIVSVIYAYTALEQAYKGSTAGFCLWLSYACANIALIWHTR